MNQVTNSHSVALVTGGSRGIGAAIAVRLAREGYAVAVNYANNHQEANQIVEGIIASGGHAVALQCDVSDPTAVTQLFDSIERQIGPVTVLVNSAGVMPSKLPTLAETDDATFDRLFAINVKGSFNTMREAARRMANGGRIVNLSSSVIGLRLPGYSVYAATKAALEAMTHIFAKELRGRSITVNAVAPGPTATTLFLNGKTPEQIDHLAKNVEAILLRDSVEEEQAFGIYQALQGKRTIYGVKIVRSDRARPGHGQPASDTVASLIQGSNQVAVAYLRGKLGNLKRANTVQEALRGERTLTLDGMLVGPGDFERLRLVPEADLQIGAGAKGQVDGLTAESRILNGKVADLLRRQKDIDGIRHAAQSLSSPETLRLLLSFAAQLDEALTEREVAHQRIVGSTSAEYQALCAKLQALRDSKLQLERDARNARDAVVRAQTVLDGLTEQCTVKLSELQSKRTVHETCRSHADYDPGYASDRWDSLLEQFGDNYQAMADHCESQSKRCNSAMVRHLGPAQTLLGTFLTDHREAVSDEVTSDWRKAKAWMEQQVTRLQNTELPQYKEQAQEAYLASQNTFRQDVALALHANLKYQTTTFKRLNDALKASPAFTNGERYQFQAKVRPDLMPLKKFIENIADFGADGGLFGEPGEIPAQFAELLREKTTTGNAAVKSPLDDYREFFEFDIEIETDDPVTGVTKTIGHLSKRIGPGSGGEHRAPLYVIAGAALSSAYRMDENNQDGLRLILLDEAFDKMDTPNIVATMRYLEKLGLQVLLASPGENLPTLTAFLHRYFEIMKDETRHVIQVEERRVSEAMREQFREDMWEYHPELLEAELLAVRQEPIARPAAATP